MLEQRYRWTNEQLRDQVEVLDGKKSPHILLKNATYLNQALRKWMQANIWIYDDRIVYVGDKVPDNLDRCEIVDCQGLLLVPGYIEPHAHPYQLYNPCTFARFASYRGTTTLIQDNLLLFMLLGKEEAFSLLEELRNIPASMYWWCRFDAQTELRNEDQIFTDREVKAWLAHADVFQGGELTGWPRLLSGDQKMLHWVQETKRRRKKIEGHFPGASEKTLAKMMLFGIDCDHEAMTGNEVLSRLMQGYTVSLRNSSIRPDLANILREIHELGIYHYDKFFFTTDGSHPSFYENGMIDAMIKIALEQGVPVIDAYNMATINVARYYHMEHLHGNIATGRVANINFLQSETDPVPVSVLAKGKWVKRDGLAMEDTFGVDWDQYGLGSMKLDWKLDMSDLECEISVGIKLINDVITKPYSIRSYPSGELEHDECFFVMVDRKGKWRVNTHVKGFANQLSGFASSYSGTGDILLIGNQKEDMLLAFDRMKEMGGGIVIVEQGKIIYEMALSLQGLMSAKEVEELIEEEKELKMLLRERGYAYADPAFTLLFFSATHLPYIRCTPKGIYDVKNKKVLYPAAKR
ncbi:adenine deaminase C-terminal domain-containing protein [Risungbinella massiliensis]|uniref:adenine deaminase C-terminal domain-containing protein n=1 Tax=Risungbinella massiliensis TaxID=1329796 RepID=UPI00164E6F7E|nr:adenine deaminase C-terminal domain-containing protein [Risungbinella massiliensis]